MEQAAKLPADGQQTHLGAGSRKACVLTSHSKVARHSKDESGRIGEPIDGGNHGNPHRLGPDESGVRLLSEGVLRMREHLDEVMATRKSDIPCAGEYHGTSRRARISFIKILLKLMDHLTG